MKKALFISLISMGCYPTQQELDKYEMIPHKPFIVIRKYISTSDAIATYALIDNNKRRFSIQDAINKYSIGDSIK